LYLNVVRPSGYENQHLPVAFWIHGGTFTNGIPKAHKLLEVLQLTASCRRRG
jgi:carboxylesterase type B